MQRSPRRFAWLHLLVLVLLFTATAHAERAKKRIAALPTNYQAWLEQVRFLIDERERDAFLEIEKDYQRDAFIEEWWKARDPFPATATNEFREIYLQRIVDAAERFGTSRFDERTKVYVLNGEPDEILDTDCGLILWPLQVWYYNYSDVSRTPVTFLFYRPSGAGPFRMWQAAEGYDPLVAIDYGAENLERLVIDRCTGIDPYKVLAFIRAAEFEGMAGPQRALRPKPIDDEWLLAFRHFSTDLPEDAEPLEAEVEIGYPGRMQNRTVVRGLLKVPIEAATVDRVGDFSAYYFQLTGEILRGEELFESFRYRFELPVDEVGDASELPLVFERYLRPGEFSMVLKLEDLASKRYFRKIELLEVPSLESAEGETAVAEGGTEESAAPVAPEIRILEPAEGVLTGSVRFEALAQGEGIHKVGFLLDGKKLLTKTRPPYSIDVALGTVPRTHTLRAVAYDRAGEEIAGDELLINAGQHQFTVDIVDPASGGRGLSGPVRVRVDVRAPEGKAIDRLELFVGDARIATLYTPPWIQPVRFRPGELAVLRAVAYLADGSSTEDFVLLNAEGMVEEADVRLVELYTTVVDGSGRPRRGLEEADFTVFENKVPQQILRFDRLENLPIHAALLLDTSASMEESLPEVRQAALRFLESTITPKDRAALITFSEVPQLATRLTNDLDELARGLAGLKAERSTALYDSIVFSLFYMKGIRGQKVLLVLSDGEDRRSERSFDEVLEAAAREGVTIYTIGLDLKKLSAGRAALAKLAEQTGGRSFFIRETSELDAIYAQIQEELRAQYLIAYQSTHGAETEGFRAVEVEVRSGGEARTLRGYYP